MKRATKIFCDNCDAYHSDIACNTNKVDIGWGAYRDWNPFDARACPMCTYENGKFIKRCYSCDRVNDLEIKLGEAKEALLIIAGVNEECVNSKYYNLSNSEIAKVVVIEFKSKEIKNDIKNT